MATYHSSILGEITGKIGELVFTSYRGKLVVKIRPRKVKDRASVELLKKVLKGEIERNELSVKLLNVRLTFATIRYLYKEKLEQIIAPVWEKLCKQKKLRMTTYNLFLKYNMTILYDSIPEKNDFYGPLNMSDFTQMLITDGDLNEPTIIKNANYSPENGKLCIEWDTNRYIDGKIDDEAHVVAFYWKPPKLKLSSLTPWTSIKTWEAEAKREDGKAVIKIDTNLEPKYLITYLFFKSQNIYSESASIRVGK
ncbi:hypothetical protein KAW65_03935 [candidate division WOR-3 bacterium]|nr:hypothetical protein [candidate division WOR-3 bacterium]